MSLSRTATRVSAVFLVALAAACGGNDTPATPATPSPSPIQATPTPTPTPVPTNCQRLGPGTEAGGRCTQQTANFQKEVDGAIAQLRAERPDIFNGRNVLSVGQYLVGVIDILEKQGLCAGYDGEELQVKINNDYSDQYHILISSGRATLEYSVTFTRDRSCATRTGSKK